MKRNAIIHLVWGLITLGTFVVGSQIARFQWEEESLAEKSVRIPPAAGQSDVTGQADTGEAADRYVPLPQSIAGKPDLVVGGQRKSPGGLLRTRKQQAARRASAREASAAQRKTGPLGKS